MVDSRLENVVLASILLRTFCDWIGASPQESRQIELCTAEALNNCVIHAYKLQPGQLVEMCVSRDGFEIIVEISDCGTAISSSELERSRASLQDTNPGDLDFIPVNGRGLSIIQSVMDSLEYKSLNGTNRLTMTKRISQPVGEEK